MVWNATTSLPVEWVQELCESESGNEGIGMNEIGLRIPTVVGAAVCIGLCGVAIPARASGPMSCDGQRGIDGDFVQVCDDGQWRSLAFPIDTTGVGSIDVIHMVFSTNTGVGDLYLLANDDGAGFCPDTSDVLWSGCEVIVEQDPSGSVFDTGGVVPVTDTTWIVAVPTTDLAFEISFTTACPLVGVAFASSVSRPSCSDWLDLKEINYGFCYCVSAETDLGPLYPGGCNAQDADEPLCETPPGVCDAIGLCDGDVNGCGSVDPLSSGAILQRLGLDPCEDSLCQYDVNCDGAIDPLDVGYVMARFGTCNPPVECVQDFCE